jgi:hypothetical protein
MNFDGTILAATSVIVCNKKNTNGMIMKNFIYMRVGKVYTEVQRHILTPIMKSIRNEILKAILRAQELLKSSRDDFQVKKNVVQELKLLILKWWKILIETDPEFLSSNSTLLNLYLALSTFDINISEEMDEEEGVLDEILQSLEEFIAEIDYTKNGKAYKIGVNMSPNLCKMFDIVPVKTAANNWKAPKKHGFDNTTEIIKALIHGLEVLQNPKNDFYEKRETILHLKNLIMRLWKDIVRSDPELYTNSSFLNLYSSLTDVTSDLTESDDEEEDCVENILNNLEEFLNEIDFEKKGKKYVVGSLMSPELCNLFGMLPSLDLTGRATSDEKAWIVPKAYGIKAADQEKLEMEMFFKQNFDEKNSDSAPQEKNSNNNLKILIEDESKKDFQVNVKSEAKSQFKQSNDDSDDDEDNEDDEDEEEEENSNDDNDNDDDDDDLPAGMVMSANLRRALGIAVDDEEEEDAKAAWKPPVFSGLTNSTRIVEKFK